MARNSGMTARSLLQRWKEQLTQKRAPEVFPAAGRRPPEAEEVAELRKKLRRATIGQRHPTRATCAGSLDCNAAWQSARAAIERMDGGLFAGSSGGRRD